MSKGVVSGRRGSSGAARRADHSGCEDAWDLGRRLFAARPHGLIWATRHATLASSMPCTQPNSAQPTRLGCAARRISGLDMRRCWEPRAASPGWNRQSHASTMKKRSNHDRAIAKVRGIPLCRSGIVMEDASALGLRDG